jgi:hypothetical protein
MTGDRHKFKEMDHAITGKVRFGDDSTVEIQGRGTILFQGKFGDQWVLSDVYYIPKLRSNLISLGQLTEIGLRVELDDDMLEVSEKNPSRLIMQVQRSLNRMYKIELNPVDPSYLMANIGDEAWLWHGRLGHINFRSLKQLAKKEMALGVPVIRHPDQVCRDCLVAKQTRAPIPNKANWHSEEVLNLVHVDLCGPTTPVTAGGNKYFMLLVDDCSRWMRVYMLKSKR